MVQHTTTPTTPIQQVPPPPNISKLKWNGRSGFAAGRNVFARVQGSHFPFPLTDLQQDIPIAE
ncbi:hypothetical protein MtrunA17_Chr8g0341241 [Medicago truncatula]|uniref:Uncharacterized protein n=1 Tax=Medicago truncatula TaxID=3880 RepID=A0A396GKL8_MEDTR|nr:hypothetical protein MtrunA17_Chr8g0341241 [Medicago truncatula]